MELIINARLQSLLSPLEEEEFKQLEANILRDGCTDPILTWDNVIIDGHNRYTICTKHSLPFKIENRDFESLEAAIDWIEENQFGRRNAPEKWKKYYLGKKYERLKRQGARTDLTSPHFEEKLTTAEKVGREAGVSRATVERAGVFAANVDAIAEVVGDNARCEILSGKDGFTQDDVAEVAEAMPEAKSSGQHFESAKDAQRWAREFVKTEKAEARKERHAAQILNIAETCKGNRPLDPSIKYPIIYADPPWKHDCANIGSDRATENHYPPMELDEICALPVKDLARDNGAVLFLWTTVTHLFESVKVVEAWGFEYVTSAVWDKQHIGCGYWFRGQHEYLLVCKRGEFPAPLLGDAKSSLYSELRGPHSAKPEYYREVIEQYYPTLPKIELFARPGRSPRPGWAVWGNQSGAELVQAA
jgi:N6-adenosine-specific RNA methylase IME4